MLKRDHSISGVHMDQVTMPPTLCHRWNVIVSSSQSTLNESLKQHQLCALVVGGRCWEISAAQSDSIERLHNSILAAQDPTMNEILAY